jgi:hypothetical protein
MIELAVWNVRGIYSKEEQLEKELTRAKVDIAIIPETKKKLKGSRELKVICCFIVAWKVVKESLLELQSWLKINGNIR